jgi:hypothetical protein
MNREIHVRFCERFRGEIPLYLLDYELFVITQSMKNNTTTHIVINSSIDNRKNKIVLCKISSIFKQLKPWFMNKLKELDKKQPKQIVHRSAEISSGLVRIAHKISSTSGESQLIKIGERYFRVRELG